ncbi:hypothetical protein DL98DRAFT_508212 [Cadophora sp. DSE1049]|nr:hypothetical protein DL98DRAFT_508212 [Cadophora sp. DSE1049]
MTALMFSAILAAVARTFFVPPSNLSGFWRSPMQLSIRSSRARGVKRDGLCHYLDARVSSLHHRPPQLPSIIFSSLHLAALGQ